MSTLWHGRFEGGPAEELMAFTVSLPSHGHFVTNCSKA